ncbi:MAG: DivIVA domain-containing protein [Actinomycetota bacterium]
MTLLHILVVLAVIAGVGAVAAGFIRGGLDDTPTAVPYAPLPDGTVNADDIRLVRFSLAFRGYRMTEVDAVLDHLTTELARRDTELAERDAELALHRESLFRRHEQGSQHQPRVVPATTNAPEFDPDSQSKGKQ